MESLSKTGYQSIRKGSDESYEVSALHHKWYQEQLRILDLPTLAVYKVK